MAPTLRALALARPTRALARPLPRLPVTKSAAVPALARAQSTRAALDEFDEDDVVDFTKEEEEHLLQLPGFEP
jgi:hypothetical protein